MELRGPPIEPIGPPLLPTSPYNGNARPPTRAEDNTPIAARIVRSGRSLGSAHRRPLPVDGRSTPLTIAIWHQALWGQAVWRVVEPRVGMLAASSRGPLRASGESLSLRQPSRIEGGELD